MPAGTGLTTQVGWGTEVTPGTAVAATKWAAITSESIKYMPSYVTSQALRNRRTPPVEVITSTRVEGDVTLEVTANSIGPLLFGAIGADAISGVGPYTHTFVPMSTELSAQTVEIQRVATRFVYAGMRTASWTLDVPNEGIVSWTSSYMGQSQATGGTLSTPTYSTDSPFTFLNATLTLGGVASCVSDVSLSGDNSLYTRMLTCGYKVNDFGRHDITGSCSKEFEDLIVYNAFVAGTPATFSLALNAGASSILTITGQVYYREASPNVSGPGVVEQPVNFVFRHATSDASTFTAVLTNTVAAAYA